MSTYFTPQQVAERVGLNEKTVRRMILRGQIKAARVGRQYRIAEGDVPLVPVQVAPRPSPRPRAARIGQPGRFSQIARDMEAA